MLELPALRGKGAGGGVLSEVGRVAAPFVLVSGLIVQHPVEEVFRAGIDAGIHQRLHALAGGMHVPILAELADNKPVRQLLSRSEIAEQRNDVCEILGDLGSAGVGSDGPPATVRDEIESLQPGGYFHQARWSARESGHDDELE